MKLLILNLVNSVLTFQSLDLVGHSAYVHKGKHTNCYPDDIKLPIGININQLYCREDFEQLVCSAPCESISMYHEWECDCYKPYGPIVFFDKNFCHWKKIENAKCAETDPTVLLEIEEPDDDDFEYIPADHVDHHGGPFMSEEMDEIEFLNDAVAFEYSKQENGDLTEMIIEHDRDESDDLDEWEINSEIFFEESSREMNEDEDPIVENYPSNMCPMLNDKWNCSSENRLRSLCTRICPSTTNLASQKCICINTDKDSRGMIDCGWKIKGHICPDFSPDYDDYNTDMMMDVGILNSNSSTKLKRQSSSSPDEKQEKDDETEDNYTELKKLLAQTMDLDVKHSTINIYM